MLHNALMEVSFCKIFIIIIINDYYMYTLYAFNRVTKVLFPITVSSSLFDNNYWRVLFNILFIVINLIVTKRLNKTVI